MLVTKRLILRKWKEEDFLPFSKMNADPDVMAFHPSTMSEEESNVVAQLDLENGQD